MTMADIKTTDERSKNMAAIRSRDTKPELFIRHGLFARGYRYRIASKSIPGHPDLYFARYHTALFVHGCFWHRHEDCKYAYTPKSREDFWMAKFRANQRRDETVRNDLKEIGCRQLVIWECAVKMSMKDKDISAKLFGTIEMFLKSETQYLEISQALLLSEDV